MPFIHVNGIQLHYAIYGEGEPLLLLHGLGASIRDWEYQIPYLSQRFKVIAFDLRGHGLSDKPDQHYSVELFSNDTHAFLNALSLDAVHVLGHSLGGMVAFQLAVDHPERVKSLTILNSAPMVPFSGIKNTLKFMLRPVSVKFFGMHPLSVSLAKMVFPKKEQGRWRETFVERWCENDPHAYLNALYAFRGWDLMDKMPGLKCPTLIISADNDYTPVSFKAQYTQAIPNAKLVVINDSCHLTNVDQADKFNETVGEFLDELSAPLKMKEL